MFKKLFILLVVVMGALTLLTAFSGTNALAVSGKDAICEGVQAGNSGASCAGGASTLSNNIKNALRVFQVIVGIVSIFYMVYAGLKFVTSGGSSDGVKSARNTILYASIGLIIVVISQFIIQFVLSNFDKP